VIDTGGMGHKFVRHFIFVFGPVGSIFDLLTCWVMLCLLQVGHTEFRTVHPCRLAGAAQSPPGVAFIQYSAQVKTPGGPEIPPSRPRAVNCQSSGSSLQDPWPPSVQERRGPALR
jgi:hypothetical protein